METVNWRRDNTFCAPLIGLWSAAAAVVPGWQAKAALLCPMVLSALWWLALRPFRWLTAFFVCLVLAPPIAGPVGDAGLHFAPAIPLVGVLAGILRLPQWRTSVSRLAF